MKKNEKEPTPKLIKQLFIEEFKDSFNDILNVTQDKFFELYERRIELIIIDTFPTFDFNVKENKDLLLQEHKNIVEDYYVPLKFLCNKTLNEYKSISNLLRRQERHLKLFNPHCFNNKTPCHTCQGKFIIVQDVSGADILVICDKCSSCYYVECIRMYCSECDTDFLSCELKENDYIYPPVTWAKYHCGVAFNQQMQCMTCNGFLWLKDDMIYCRKCKKKEKAGDIEWICMICKKIFHTEAKIYNPLEFKEMKLAVKNAIVNKLILKPTYLPCGCDDNPLKLNFYHRDNCKGILYSGDIFQKKIVVCSDCKVFCSLKKYAWTCPICKQQFKTTSTRIFKSETEKTIIKVFNKSVTGRPSIDMSPSAFKDRNRVIDINSMMKNLNYFSPQNQKEDKGKKKNVTQSQFKLSLVNEELETKRKNTESAPRKRDTPPRRRESPSPLKKDPPQTTKNTIKIDQRLKVSASPNKIRPKSPGKLKNQISLMYGSNKNSLNHDNNEFFSKKSVSIDEETVIPIKEFNVEDYKIVSQIGKGSYGKIYLVEDRKKESYSLKKLIVCDKEQYLSITREYDIYAKCKHKHILSIYGMSNRKLDDTTYSIYILMEVGLTDWEKEIEQRKVKNHFYSEGDLVNILKQLTSALVYLQRNKVSHRDIKAQNILVFKNRVFKLADFGEARQLSRTDPKLLTLRGTELYMSPLLFMGLQSMTLDVKHNPYKSDVYSLGLCIVYGATLNIRNLMMFRELKDYSKVKSYLQSLLFTRYSSAFIELIQKMMIIQEEDRPDFIEFEEQLNNLNN